MAPAPGTTSNPENLDLAEERKHLKRLLEATQSGYSADVDRLIFRHLEQRRRLQARMARLRALQTQRAQTLSGDMEQYRDIRQGMREKADFQRSRNRGDYGPAMS